MAFVGDGNHSDRSYEPESPGIVVARPSVPLPPPRYTTTAKDRLKKVIRTAATRQSAYDLQPQFHAPLIRHTLISVPHSPDTTAWITHIPLHAPAGVTSQTMLDKLWELHPLSRSEHGVMHGIPWNSGDRRRTLPVCNKGLVYRYNGSAWTSPDELQTFEQQPLVAALRDFVCAQISVDDPKYAEKAMRPFNFCLINFYTSDGSLSMHSDSESDLVPDYPIASLSYSTAPRRFDVQENESHCGGRRPRKWEFWLNSGDLLVMGGAFQKLAKHAIPKHVMGAPYRRVNLTFRMVKEAGSTQSSRLKEKQ